MGPSMCVLMFVCEWEEEEEEERDAGSVPSYNLTHVHAQAEQKKALINSN